MPLAEPQLSIDYGNLDLASLESTPLLMKNILFLCFKRHDVTSKGFMDIGFDGEVLGDAMVVAHPWARVVAVVAMDQMGRLKLHLHRLINF